MDPLGWVIVGIATVTTLWLLYYVRIRLRRELELRLDSSVQAFSTAVELRFPTHTGLSERISDLATAMGRELGLPKKIVMDLRLAARLRDIGLCEVPYSLINGKARGDWTAEEYQTYLRHSEISGAMLDLVPSLRHLSDTVRFHHTPYDDPSALSGQPRREAIPLQARVLKVATEYAWFEREVGAESARDILCQRRGSHYCPRAVDALFRVLTSGSGAELQPSVAV